MHESDASILPFVFLLACSGVPPGDLVSSPAVTSEPPSLPNGGGGGAMDAPATVTDAPATVADATVSGGSAEDAGAMDGPEIFVDSAARNASGDDADAQGLSGVGTADALPVPSADSATDAGKGVYVQIATATPPSFVTSAVATFLDAQTEGNLNVAAIGWEDTTADVADVSDTAGNRYQLAVGPTRAGGISQSIFYASGIRASASGNSVQVRFARAVPQVDLRVVEYSGLDRTMPLDAVAASSGNGTVATSGSATTKAAIELVFGAGSATDAFSKAGSRFVPRIVTADGNLVEDRIVASPGTYSADAVLRDSVDWVMQLATFR